LAHDPTDAVGAEVTPGHGRHGRAPRQGGASLAPTPALEASTLRELGRLAGLVQPRLLALHLARVARQEALPLERHAQLRVRLDERPGDAVPDRARLAADAAAVHAHAQVVRARGASDLERRHRELAVQGRGKYSSSVLPLIHVFPSPGRRMTRATDVLRLPVPRYCAISAIYSSSSLGACATCGCSG